MVCVGFGIYGVLNIKLDYDAIWFMDQKSYQTQYFKRFEEAFPDQGERVEVYIGECIIYLSIYSIKLSTYNLVFQCNFFYVIHTFTDLILFTI